MVTRLSFEESSAVTLQMLHNVYSSWLLYMVKRTFQHLLGGLITAAKDSCDLETGHICYGTHQGTSPHDQL